MRPTTLGLVAVLACGTTPLSFREQLTAFVRVGPTALSPSKLSDLRGLEIGMFKGAALARFSGTNVHFGEGHPGFATGDIAFNGQTARLGLTFDDDRLSMISLVLPVFQRNVVLLRATYGAPDSESDTEIEWGAGKVSVVFFYLERVDAFELLFHIDDTSGGADDRAAAQPAVAGGRGPRLRSEPRR